MRALLALLALCASGCAHRAESTALHAGVTVAVETNDQVTGVAVARGRLFLAFPNWVERPRLAIAEVLADGNLVPFPSAEWNAWDGTPGEAAARAFVCAQSVWSDGRGSLWIMDPASPDFGGVIEGGAKLVRVDLRTNLVARVYALDEGLAPRGSYLNDVRTDPSGRWAVMADALMGALVVLDLKTGRGVRRLEGHSSTKADPSVEVVVAGVPWRTARGSVPQIHVDGLALDPRGELVYFQALTGRTLFRVPLKLLVDGGTSEETLRASVEEVITTHPADGIAFGREGQLFVTDLERGAVSEVDLETRTRRTLVRDTALLWPDTIAVDDDGSLYVTAAQIHRMPGWNQGRDLRRRPFQVLRIRRQSDAVPHTQPRREQ